MEDGSNNSLSLLQAEQLELPQPLLMCNVVCAKAKHFLLLTAFSQGMDVASARSFGESIPSAKLMHFTAM